MTKIHAVTDDKGRPASFLLTSGNSAGCKTAIPMLSGFTAAKQVLADKAIQDSDNLYSDNTLRLDVYGRTNRANTFSLMARRSAEPPTW
jgi:hypothetical protein